MREREREREREGEIQVEKKSKSEERESYVCVFVATREAFTLKLNSLDILGPIRSGNAVVLLTGNTCRT